MKSSLTHPHFFAHTLKVVKDETSAEQQNKSPYLKAILSGTRQALGSEKNSTVTNPDREAALRYIKESAVLRK